MDRTERSVYLSEVITQCWFVGYAGEMLAAADQALTNAIENKQPIWPHRSLQFWFAVQSMLVAAGNLAKVLWGDRGEQEEARRELRETLGVDDATTKLKDAAKVRNGFEHFEDRVRLWAKRPPAKRGNFWSRSVGAFPGTGYFGHYDPSTGVVTFGKASVSLVELVREVEAILAAAERAEYPYRS